MFPVVVLQRIRLLAMLDSLALLRGDDLDNTSHPFGDGFIGGCHHVNPFYGVKA